MFSAQSPCTFPLRQNNSTLFVPKTGQQTCYYKELETISSISTQVRADALRDFFGEGGFVLRILKEFFVRGVGEETALDDY